MHAMVGGLLARLLPGRSAEALGVKARCMVLDGCFAAVWGVFEVHDDEASFFGGSCGGVGDLQRCARIRRLRARVCRVRQREGGLARVCLLEGKLQDARQTLAPCALCRQLGEER